MDFKSPDKKTVNLFPGTRISLTKLIDSIFFIFAGVASFWLAWLVFQESWKTGGWWMAGLFMAAWIVLAYLGLPRLHRILSSLYVPNYFFGRTLTADGLLGDPINIALKGTESQLKQAFEKAGWQLADEVTPKTALRMLTSTIGGKSYPTAPVSGLFLFNRRHDFAYQQEVDGSPHKRHHVRLWRCPEGWLLPGGHKVDWLAAATYDKSVGLSLFTFQITHKIDGDIDTERDYIVESLAQSNKIETTLLKDFSTGYHSRNGGGDNIRTDGDLPVISLAKLTSSNAFVDSKTGIIDTDEPLIRQIWEQRPPQILIGSILVMVATLFSLIALIGDMTSWTILSQIGNLSEQGMGIGAVISILSSDSGVTSRAVMIIAVGMATIELFLTVNVLRGGGNSRLILLTIASVTTLLGLTSFGVQRELVPVELMLFIGLHLLIVLAFSSDEARRYTKTKGFNMPF